MDWTEEYFDSLYDALEPKVRLPTSDDLLHGIAAATYNDCMLRARSDQEDVLAILARLRRMQSKAKRALDVSNAQLQAHYEDQLTKKEHVTIKKAVSANEECVYLDFEGSTEDEILALDFMRALVERYSLESTQYQYLKGGVSRVSIAVHDLRVVSFLRETPP